MLQADEILRMHDETTRRWHDDPSPSHPVGPSLQTLDYHSDPTLLSLATTQHRANYDLWHQEDEARNSGASDATIAAVKHDIDHINQRRNDLVEQIDLLLMASAGPQNSSSPLHSETPALIIDRLSILALKLYHTAQESRRESATDHHRSRNLVRLDVLTQQRADLALCLDELWTAVLAGTRRFKLYRQMKMYNDPDLNPVLYLSSLKGKSGD